MTIDAVDSQGTQSSPADLQLSAANAAASASATSKNSYEVTVDGLQLRLNKDYTFLFRYLLQNDDPSDKSQNFGPYSPAFVVTAAEVYAALPDNRTVPSNVTTLGGFNSYQVKWDKPTFAGYVDTIVWESPTNTFTSASTVVYAGSSNQINILTSNTDVRYVKIIHRDKFLHANIDPSLDTKYIIVGPITPKDPVVIDTTGPSNVSGVSTTGGIDTTGYLGFNGYVDVSWSAVTGGDIRGYRIRFKPIDSSVYSYADSPGTGTSYRLTGLAVGVTYNIEVATYDQYNNTSTSYIAGTNISIPGTPTMSGYIAAGAFKFGDGVVTGKRGLYFNDSNYWYINSSSTAEFKLGGPTTNYISWDGSELKVTGNLGVDGSTKIGGNIQLTSAGASIYNGTINTNGNLTGNGFALNSTGLKVANGTNAVTLDASTGTITANAGSIGGWTLADTRLSKNNALIDSSGYISLGDTSAGTIVKLSATDPNYRIWVGNNNGSLASFSVSTTGALYATNANITGTVVITGGSTKTAIDKATTDSASALTKSQEAQDAVALKMAASDINTVLGLNTTVINGSRITTGTIDVARLNITGGNTTNGFVVDGNGIRGYKDGVQALTISSTGTISLTGAVNATSGSFGGWTIANGYINGSDIWLYPSTTPGGEAINYSLITTRAVAAKNLFATATTGDAITSAGNVGITGSVVATGSYGTGSGSYTTTSGNITTGTGNVSTLTGEIKLGANITRLLSDGQIFADTLGTTTRTPGSGVTLVQSTSGYIKVYSSTSSRKYKENISSFDTSNSYSVISQMNPVTFNYKPEFSDYPEELHLGLIAEEVHDLEQNGMLVVYKDGVPDSVAYEKIPMYLVSAFKEMAAKIKDLELRLDSVQP